MTKHLPILLSGFLVALAACSSNVDFRIDNPTDAPLTVTIDGKPYTAAPHADAPVSLAPGKHSFESPVTGKVDIIVYVNMKGGIINPTLGDYIVANEIYATDAKAAKGFFNMPNKIIIGNERFVGPFRVFSTLFINKDWTYDAHEDFPESTTVSGDKGGNIYSKVFAAPDFVAFYRRRFGVPETLDKAPPPVARTVDSTSELPHFDDPETEKMAAPMREEYARYSVCTDPAEQKRLQESTGPAVTKLLTYMAPRMSKQSREENEKYNDFVLAYGHGFGASARIMPAARAP